MDTFDPHEPWDPPQWYVDLYDPGYEGEEVIYPAYGPCDYLSEAELRHVRALYAGEVTLVDRWVGMLLRKVKDLGLLDNTAIFFTTDHGFYLGEHGLIGKAIIRGKAAQAIPLYEEMIRIPLIIRLPRAKSGRRCDALVQPADIMPTILDLAGVKDPETMHGRSLVPLLIRKKRSLRGYAVSSWSIIRGPAAWRPSTITMDEWALIYGGRWAPREGYPTTQVVDSISRTERAFVGEKEPELYHLPSDPKQEKNVFAKNKDVAKRLHAEYIRFLQSVGTPEEYLRGRKEL